MHLVAEICLAFTFWAMQILFRSVPGKESEVSSFPSLKMRRASSAV